MLSDEFPWIISEFIGWSTPKNSAPNTRQTRCLRGPTSAVDQVQCGVVLWRGEVGTLSLTTVSCWKTHWSSEFPGPLVVDRGCVGDEIRPPSYVGIISETMK